MKTANGGASAPLVFLLIGRCRTSGGARAYIHIVFCLEMDDELAESLA